METNRLFAGLSKQQVFAVMSATIEVAKELPARERDWNPVRYWRGVGLLICALAGAAVSISYTASLPIVPFVIGAPIALSTLLGVAGVIFVCNKRRLELLRAQKIGLEQLYAAAKNNPDASASQLLAIIP